jgi:hypothetical protein
MQLYPATDTVAQEHVERLRAAAMHDQAWDIEQLAILARDLLVACRAAHLQARQSCADAVDIVTQVLAKHELLPAEQEG